MLAVFVWDRLSRLIGQFVDGSVPRRILMNRTSWTVVQYCAVAEILSIAMFAAYPTPAPPREAAFCCTLPIAWASFRPSAPSQATKSIGNHQADEKGPSHPARMEVHGTTGAIRPPTVVGRTLSITSGSSILCVICRPRSPRLYRLRAECRKLAVDGLEAKDV